MGTMGSLAVCTAVQNLAVGSKAETSALEIPAVASAA